jgi:hypothetical protein
MVVFRVQRLSIVDGGKVNLQRDVSCLASAQAGSSSWQPSAPKILPPLPSSQMAQCALVPKQVHLCGRRYRALVQQRAPKGAHILRRQQVVLRLERQASGCSKRGGGAEVSGVIHRETPETAPHVSLRPVWLQALCLVWSARLAHGVSSSFAPGRPPSGRGAAPP